MSIKTAITMQGEAALRVQFTDGAREERWQHVQGLMARLEAIALPAITGAGSAYDSILVEFDPIAVSPHDLAALLTYAASDAPGDTTNGEHGRHFRIPACYGGEDGPDLGQVARLFACAPDVLAETHASPWHLIRAYGSPAASPLMDGPDASISVPRRPSPRVRVPGGSLALAGAQSIIYSVPAPGGWQLIGRTPIELVSPHRTPVCAYRAGDHIGYFPITRREWDRYEGRPLEEFSV